MTPRKCFIFDLDGTLADDSHRQHHMENGDWSQYFALCHADPLIAHIAECANALHAFGYRIVVISGRNEEVRAETLKWLEKNLKCAVDHVYLRRKGDFRANSTVKLEALAELRALGYEPLMVFDDQPQVCSMWRAAGVPCAQVKGAEDFQERLQK